MKRPQNLKDADGAARDLWKQYREAVRRIEAPQWAGNRWARYEDEGEEVQSTYGRSRRDRLFKQWKGAEFFAAKIAVEYFDKFGSSPEQKKRAAARYEKAAAALAADRLLAP